MTTNKAQEEKAKAVVERIMGRDLPMPRECEEIVIEALASAERDAVERTIERCRRIALDLKDKHLDDSLKYLGGYIEACEEIAEVIKTINLKPKG